MKTSKIHELEELITDVENLIHNWREHISKAKKTEMLGQYFQNMMCLSKRYKNLEIGNQAERLTNREKDIINMICQGNTTKEISHILNISPYTIETHRANIFDKLDVRNVQELILFGVRSGMVE